MRIVGAGVCLVIAVWAACARPWTATPRAAAGLLSQIDHLVYATPDLALGIDTADKLFGVRATPGGQHPGEGTRNALIALGPTSYFEIIGPDPEQPSPERGRRFGIDDLKAPRLTTWVAKGKDLQAFADNALVHGVFLVRMASSSRGATRIRASSSPIG